MKMKQPYMLVTNILNKDGKGNGDGREFELKDGETKLLPKGMAEKFAELMATEIFHNMKQDLVSKTELQEMKDKMLGSEMVEVEFPDKEDVDILIEEIEYANNKYLKN